MKVASQLFLTLLTASCSSEETVAKAKAAGLNEPRDTVSIAAGAFMGRSSVCSGAEGYVPRARDRLWSDPDPLSISEPYAIDKHTVTCAEYTRCVDLGMCAPFDKKTNGTIQHFCSSGDVAFTQFEHAAKFCAWKGGKLPSYLEWQRAVRGVSGRRTPPGTDLNLAFDCPARPARCDLLSEDGVTYTVNNLNQLELTRDDGCPLGPHNYRNRLAINLAGVILDQTTPMWGGALSAGAEFRCVYPVPKSSK